LIIPINCVKNSPYSPYTLRLILCIVALAHFSNGNAQIDILRYTTATDSNYWKRYTHIPKPPRLNLKRFSVSGATRKTDAFLAGNIGYFPQFTNDSTPEFTVKELRKCLFPVDINGDNLADMIFSGSNGGESGIVQIWLNRKDSFELIFEDYQYLTKLKKINGKVVDLQTGDPGTSDRYLYFTRDYRVDNETHTPVFIKGKQIVAYRYNEEPAGMYPVPLPFTAKADTMMLRASAARQDEPFDPKLDTFGNIVAKYRTRAKGMVLARKSAGPGNDWYYVEVYPYCYPSASILYDLDKIPTFIRGWVSSQSIRLD
jgi:hypothetical protein